MLDLATLHIVGAGPPVLVTSSLEVQTRGSHLNRICVARRGRRLRLAVWRATTDSVDLGAISPPRNVELKGISWLARP